MLSRPQGEIPFPTNPSIYPFSLPLHAHFLSPFPTFRPSPVVAAPARVSRLRPHAPPPARPPCRSKEGRPSRSSRPRSPRRTTTRMTWHTSRRRKMSKRP